MKTKNLDKMTKFRKDVERKDLVISNPARPVKFEENESVTAMPPAWKGLFKWL